MTPQGNIPLLLETSSFITQNVWSAKEWKMEGKRLNQVKQGDSTPSQATCQNKYIVYLITCLLCEEKPQYVGQSTQKMSDARKRLDNLEADFQNRLMTMNFHGGMNDRDDRRRENRA